MSKKKNGTKLTDLIASEIQASAPAPKPVEPPAPPKPVLTNHIVLLLDDSGSMRGCYSEAVRQINLNIRNIKAKAAETGQRTTMSLYLFGGYSQVRCQYSGMDVARVTELDTYFASGSSTPLNDAIGQAIQDARRLVDAGDPNTSFLIICATDGGENGSRRFNRYDVERLIKETQGTDRWTFSFMVPPGSKRQTVNATGVPSGNVIEWNNDYAGAQKAFAQTAAATSNYYASRATGLKSTKQFYTTDLSKLSKTELSKLNDLSGNFRKWNVDREVDIKTFIEAHGLKFVLGAGYYPVTKKELLRTGRNILVREKGTNRIFGGQEARSVLGIPSGEVTITPGNHANYDIFFQSTSVNRKLVRGTELLLDKTQVVDLAETWDSAAAKAAADAKAAQKSV
jgi:hypothetical protein